jgi:serine/threonine-protein phosphatase 2A regulatory subunit B
VQTPGGSDWNPEFRKHPNRPVSPFILLEETLKTPLEKKVFDEEIPELKDTLEFKFSQVKGTNDDEVSDADIISTVQFNEDGELLATGDKGGRIVIFKRDNPDTSEYNVYSTFQSHEPEFDYLKSLEIEEKINKIKWLPRRTDSHFLLSTNDKTIKLWKISERQSKVQGWNTKSDEEGYPEVDMDTSEGENNSKITSLQVPKVVPSELVIESYPKKIYANAHTYHINSISCNSDAMTFLSADDLRVNVWNLESTNNSFNVVDIKPNNMEDLSEVITSAEFHPLHCHIFAYSSSRGTIRLCDMRESALCDNHKLLFEQEENPQERSFFSEIIASVSDIAFSPCGRYVLSRDYLTVKLWDLVNVGRGPVKTFPVHPFLSQKLCTLYENDCIFDKFEVCWSHDASNFMTGSYNNLFRVGNINTDPNRVVEEYSVNSPSHVYQATIDPNDLPSKRNEQIRPILQPKKIMNSLNPLTKKKRNEICLDSLDYRQKVLHSDWHPKEHIVAVAATNRLLIYDSKNSPASQ